ncbi:MAG TPA: methionyl-tRNA formyltransferase, partial [Solirubrobacterales bacterium]|nr:methionyl-tRNA formyltransferase [Solirubrobacterales bacterium]
MRIVFLGSGSFAIPSFEALLDAGHELAALITQPDREKGRGRALAPPPLKPVAEARLVNVLQPPRVRGPEVQEALRSLRPDAQVVVAYGQILPPAVIDIPRLGTVNVHASLLPRYRGAAPIAWAIARGETETGVTTMLVDEGLDTGPMLLRRAISIGPDETTAELTPRLARLGAELLVETLRELERGALRPEPQDPAQATHAPILKKEDGRIDWTQPAPVLACRVRGLNPWPGAFTKWGGARLAVWRARAAPGTGAAPGQILGSHADALLVACGAGTTLALLELQPEGRKRMSGAAFALGARPGPDARL